MSPTDMLTLAAVVVGGVIGYLMGRRARKQAGLNKPDPAVLNHLRERMRKLR